MVDRREYHKRYYAKNKDRFKQYQKLHNEHIKDLHSKYNKAQSHRKRENKRRAIELKGGRCARCGGQFPEVVYDFHHVNHKEKEKDLTRFFRDRSCSWEEIQRELDKCILLCANCHRIIHEEEGYAYVKDRRTQEPSAPQRISIQIELF